MSVHLDPRQQPVNPIVRTNGQQPASPTQKRLPFGDVLEIRKEDTGSWLDCFKNCFKAIWDFIQRLFSKEPAKDEEKAIKEVAGDAVHPRIVPVPKIVNGGVFLKQEFARQDYNYDGRFEKEIQDLMAAEHECDYPKLALYLRDAFEIDLMEATKRINAVRIKHSHIKTLTPKFVMESY